MDQCRQQGCEAESVAIAHWPGQDTEQCEEHCRALGRDGHRQIAVYVTSDRADHGIP